MLPSRSVCLLGQMTWAIALQCSITISFDVLCTTMKIVPWVAIAMEMTSGKTSAGCMFIASPDLRPLAPLSVSEQQSFGKVFLHPHGGGSRFGQGACVEQDIDDHQASRGNVHCGKYCDGEIKLSSSLTDPALAELLHPWS